MDLWGSVAPLILEIELRGIRDFFLEFRPLRTGEKIFELSLTNSEIGTLDLYFFHKKYAFFHIWGPITSSPLSLAGQTMGRCIAPVWRFRTSQ